MARKVVVVIKDMKPYNDATEPFGPNNIVAVISDARDVGVQLYANDNGSVYFTLPVDHPAVQLIDPLKQHYFVQRWDNGEYVTVQGGIITDYDASDNEVVISGVDYMSALNKYYTPLPGPKIGQKAIPDTDETVLAHASTTKYNGAYDTGKNIYGRDYGTKPRNYPNSGYNMSTVGPSYITYANLEISPLPSTSIETITPKEIIANAVSMDKEITHHGQQVSVFDSVDSSNGDIRIFSGVPQAGTTPTGKENEITVDYEQDVNGAKTGNIKITGSMFIFKGPNSSSATYLFVDGDTGAECRMAFSVEMFGFLVYASPGGPLYWFAEPGSPSNTVTDAGDTDHPLQFSLTLRPISKYAAATEDAYGLTRTVSILTDGVNYSFALKPFYIGYFTTPSTSVPNYRNYIWGEQTKFSSTGTTSGLKSNNVTNIVTSTIADVMDRTKDYTDISVPVTSCSLTSMNVLTVVLPTAASAALSVGTNFEMKGSTSGTINSGSYTITSFSGDRKTITASAQNTNGSKSSTGGTMEVDASPLLPIVKFMTVEQTNTTVSTSKHAYATAGQGPIEFLREVVELEMGTRTDQSKVIFNFYGVPGSTPTGKKLIVNHNVSATSQDTLIFPGQIRSYNVVNRRSKKLNSVRVVPTTDFLIGTSTEGAGSVKSQGVVKNPSYSITDPALPSVVTQGGFVSSESAGNFGQGIINDFGTNSDVTDIRVQLRSEVYGPIGCAGTPKLGESVRVVINRKSVTVAGDSIDEIYNVGGMEWIFHVDGHEELYLDLVKPNKFVGPAITWDAKPAPGAEKTSFKSNSEKKPKKKKKKEPVIPPTYKIYNKPILAADGKTWLPAPSDPAAKFLVGTGYMWAGPVGGGKKRKKSVGLPRTGSTGGGYGQGGGGR